MLRIVVIIFLLILVCKVQAQDITNIKDKKALKVTGGFYTNETAYDVHGMSSRLDPFSWTLGANLNFSIYEVLEMPFSFSYSKGSRVFNQPSFNQFGASPRYKFVTIHLGYRSMQLSNYSLSGVMFLGAGIEIAPKNSMVQFSAMFGKFAKAVPYDSARRAQSYSNNLFDVPGYERWGCGGKLTVGSKVQNISFVTFKAWDDPNSIPEPSFSSAIKPKENFIIGLAGTSMLADKIKLTGEYTLSAFTADLRAERQTMETFSYINNLGSLFQPRTSTTNNAAYSLSIGYSGDIWDSELSFKHIDPDYLSLGTTFLSNDLEDYLIKVGRVFFDHRLNISVNGGLQRNNLSHQLLQDNKRLLSGIDLSFLATEKLSFNVNYSNYSASTSPSMISVVDTFKFVQVTNNCNFNATYNFGNQFYKHSVSLSLLYQIVNTLNRTAILVTENGTHLYNANLAYSFYLISLKSNFTTSLNYYQYIADSRTTTKTFGPSFCIAKPVLKNKFKLSYAVTFLKNFIPPNDDWIRTMRIAANYRVGKHHSYQLSGNYLNKKIAQTNPLTKKDIHEFRASFSYNYTF